MKPQKLRSQPFFIPKFESLYMCLYLFGFFGWGLASFSGWQGLLGPNNNCCAFHGGLGKILAVPLFNNQGLNLVQRSAGARLHGDGLFSFGDL